MSSITTRGCVALTWHPAAEGQGWPEDQATPAATVDHVWNASFWLFFRVMAETLVRE